MKNKKETKAWKILEFIGSNSDGKTLTSIQYFIWTVLDKKSEESFWERTKTWGYSDNHVQLRASRGHWCTALYGTYFGYTGLLHEYCKKVGQKWVLDHMPNPNTRIFKPSRNFHTYKY